MSQGSAALQAELIDYYISIHRDFPFLCCAFGTLLDEANARIANDVRQASARQIAPPSKSRPPVPAAASPPAQAPASPASTETRVSRGTGSAGSPGSASRSRRGGARGEEGDEMQ